MENKKNDLVLNMIGNPDFGIDDFKAVDFDATNTSLLDESKYKADERITNSPWFQNEQGEFSDEKFHKFYNLAETYYSLLANDAYERDYMSQFEAHRDNIWADKKSLEPNFSLVRYPNPDRLSNGLVRVGKEGERRLSRSEIAQTQKVLMNPVEAEKDPSKAVWHDAPNDSWFTDFWDTRVLALWDTDGVHVDPITGEQTQHKKGELKLNDNGTYYYESLDGRDIYGRQVLSKLDTLTTDGSVANRFDFLESDDIAQKSIAGTLARSAVLIGSMYIPYIGPYIAATSALTLIVGLGTILGKMVAGSDSPTLSAIEGWCHSVNRQTSKTEYSQEHTWSWENFLGATADLMGQIAEQRAIFLFVPALFKGTSGMTGEVSEGYRQAKLLGFKNDGLLNLKAEINNNLNKIASVKLSNLFEQGGQTSASLLKALAELAAQTALKAGQTLEQYMNSYYKIGGAFSKMYMAGLISSTLYGEAKLQGVDDIDATVLTLGRFAAEMALLNTPMGEWFLPELRMGTAQKRQVLRSAVSTLQKEKAKAAAEATGNAAVDKRKWLEKVFQIGRNLPAEGRKIMEAEGGAAAFKASLANGIESGTVNDIEEFLNDFAKLLYNTKNWLVSDDNRMEAWGNAFDRYGMGMATGVVGGTATSMLLDRNFAHLHALDHNLAWGELIAAARNGRLNDYMKEIDKCTFGDKYHSEEAYQDAETGEWKYRPGTETDNQDLAIKKALKQQLLWIDKIINAEGLKLSDSSFLDLALLKDFRASALLNYIVKNSASAGLLLLDFQETSVKILSLMKEINALRYPNRADVSVTPLTDGEKRHPEELSEEVKKAISDKEAELKQLIAYKDDLIAGKQSGKYLAAALFEVTGFLSNDFVPGTFELYAEVASGKPFANITEEEIKALQPKYAEYLKSGKKYDVLTASLIHYNIQRRAAQALTDGMEAYNEMAQSPLLKKIQQAAKLISDLYTNPNLNMDDDTWLSNVGLSTAQLGAETLKSLVAPTATLSQLFSQLDTAYANGDAVLSKQLFSQARLEVGKEAFKLFEELFKPYTEASYLNSEAKTALLSAIDEVDKLVTNLLDDIEDRIDTAGQLTDALLALVTPLLGESYDFDNVDDIGLDVFNAWVAKRDQMKLALANKPSTPIEKNLDTFILSVAQNPFKLSELLTELNNTAKDNQDDMTAFSLDDTVADLLEEALKLVRQYKKAILAARTDTGGLDNIQGFNTTLNEVNQSNENWQPLAEVEGKIADAMLQDIDVIGKKLEYFNKLYNIARNLKLGLLSRVDYKATGIRYKKLLTYANNLKALIDRNIIKDVNIDSLINALNGEDMQMLKDLSANDAELKIPADLQIAFEKAKLSLDKAIYNFFNVDNPTLLTDVDKLATILSPTVLQYYKSSNTILTDKSTDYDDAAFLWTDLCANAAIKPEVFYTRLENILKEDKTVAPIPGQTLSVKLNYAAVMNGNVFNLFSDACRKAVYDYVKVLTPDARYTLYQEMQGNTKLGGFKVSEIPDAKIQKMFEDAFYLNHSAAFTGVPTLSNMTLVEGIPGAGKTKGVLKMLKRMLEGTPALNNVWLCSASTELSEEINKGLGGVVKAENIYTRTKLLSKIADGTFKRPTKPDGTKQIDPSEFTFDAADGALHSSATLLNNIPDADIPSLIVVDEVGTWCYLDLDILNEFARLHGITVITCGDLDQPRTRGNVTIDGYTIVTELMRESSPRSPKQGVSMRSNNACISETINSFLQALLTKVPKRITLAYYEDQHNLIGVKGMPRDEVTKESLQATVDKMIEGLKPGEKITLISDDPKSITLQLFQENKYAAYLQTKPSVTSALGLEGPSYIIDLHNDGSLNFLEELYGGFSRASNNAIVITNRNPNIEFTYKPYAGVPAMETIPPEAVERYSTRYLNILSAVNQGSTPETTELIPRSPITTRPSVTAAVASNPLSAGVVIPSGAAAPSTTPVTLAPTVSAPHGTMSFADAAQEAKRLNQANSKVIDGDTLVDDLYDLASCTIYFPVQKEDGTVDLLGYYRRKNASGSELIIQGFMLNLHPLLFYWSKTSNLWKPFFSLSEDGRVWGNKEYEDGDFDKFEWFDTVAKALPEPDLTKLDFVSIADPNIDSFCHFVGDTHDQTTTADIKTILRDDVFKNLTPIDPKAAPNPDGDECISSEALDSVAERGEKLIGANTTLAAPIVLQKDSKGAYMIPSMVYTHLRYSYGVPTNGKDLAKPVELWDNTPNTKGRIDGINGLMKLISKKTLGEYIIAQDYILSVLINSPSRNEAAKLLAKYFKGNGVKDVTPDKILFTWRLMTLPDNSTISSGLHWYTGKDPRYYRFDRYAKEEYDAAHLGVTDPKALMLNRNPLICTISIGGQDKVDFTMGALDSPHTIMLLTYQDANGNAVQPFADILTYYQGLAPGEDKIGKVIKKFESVPEYANFINRCKIWHATSYNVFELDDFWLNDSTKTENLGICPAVQKGTGVQSALALEDGDPIFVAEWADVDSIANLPDRIVSDQVYIARAVSSGVTSIKPGHPYILVSYDRTINKALLEAEFEKQLRDQSLPKRVTAISVLPPTYTFDEFIDNLSNKISKKVGVIDLGDGLTMYKIWKLLLNANTDHKLNSIFKEMFGELLANVIMNNLLLIVTDLDSKTDIKDKMNYLALRRHSNVNWSAININGWNRTGTTASTRSALQFLLHLIHRNANYATYSGILNNLLGPDFVIYASVKIPKNISKDINIPITSRALPYSINGKKFKIHCSVHSPTFRYTEADALFEDMVNNKLRSTTRGLPLSVDNDAFLGAKPESPKAPAVRGLIARPASKRKSTTKERKKAIKSPRRQDILKATKPSIAFIETSNGVKIPSNMALGDVLVYVGDTAFTLKNVTTDKVTVANNSGQYEYDLTLVTKVYIKNPEAPADWILFSGKEGIATAVEYLIEKYPDIDKGVIAEVFKGQSVSDTVGLLTKFDVLDECYNKRASSEYIAFDEEAVVRRWNGWMGKPLQVILVEPGKRAIVEVGNDKYTALFSDDHYDVYADDISNASVQPFTITDEVVGKFSTKIQQVRDKLGLQNITQITPVNIEILLRRLESKDVKFNAEDADLQDILNKYRESKKPKSTCSPLGTIFIDI